MAAPQPAPLPPLVTVTGKVSPKTEQLYMCTNNTGTMSNESLFYSTGGLLMFRLQNKKGVFSESKELTDSQGNVLLTCKKNPISLAKWSIKGPGGTEVAKTRTVPGMVKYGVEVFVTSHGSDPVFLLTPDGSLRHCIIRQLDGKGKAQREQLVCDAAFGPSVVMGWMSSLTQNWSYLMELEPGADAALVAAMLVIFTDLLEWEAASGFM